MSFQIIDKLLVYPTPDFNRLYHWLNLCLTHLKIEEEEINYVFISDTELLEINQRFLQHDTFTDIITFNLTELPGDPLIGEIYISLERVDENAKDFGVTFENELLRVMSHGILHLSGLGDKTQAEINVMRTMEEKLIKIYYNVPRET